MLDGNQGLSDESELLAVVMLKVQGLIPESKGAGKTVFVDRTEMTFTSGFHTREDCKVGTVQICSRWEEPCVTFGEAIKRTRTDFLTRS